MRNNFSFSFSLVHLALWELSFVVSCIAGWSGRDPGRDKHPVTVITQPDYTPYPEARRVDRCLGEPSLWTSCIAGRRGREPWLEIRFLVTVTIQALFDSSCCKTKRVNDVWWVGIHIPPLSVLHLERNVQQTPLSSVVVCSKGHRCFWYISYIRTRIASICSMD